MSPLTVSIQEQIFDGQQKDTLHEKGLRQAVSKYWSVASHKSTLMSNCWRWSHKLERGFIMNVRETCVGHVTYLKRFRSDITASIRGGHSSVSGTEEIYWGALTGTFFLKCSEMFQSMKICIFFLSPQCGVCMLFMDKNIFIFYNKTDNQITWHRCHLSHLRNIDDFGVVKECNGKKAQQKKRGH